MRWLTADAAHHRPPAAVYAACLLSLAIGLSFVFVWSPLPFGWQGIDSYYEIAKGLAAGKPFPVVHIPWGYAYFLAPWYWLFGDRPWIPLVVQTLVNASIPLMLYHLVRIEIGARYGVMAAIITAIGSFNTAYASTQSSDSICTVLVVATMLCLSSARVHPRWRVIVLAGLLGGLSFQFRPNLILFPAFVAVVYVLRPPHRRLKVAHMALFLGVCGLVAMPWVVRNYRFTGLFIPASTHGGVQLWFGSLQSGPYQSNWLYNPRAAFEFPPLDYSSMVEFPAIVSGLAVCGDPGATRVDLAYWTHADPAAQRMHATASNDGRFEFALPSVPDGTELSYYLVATSTKNGRNIRSVAPAAGADDPGIFVLSSDHFADMDAADLVIDVFDLARLMRWLSWGVDPAPGPKLDLDRNGATTEADLQLGATVLATMEPLALADAPVVVTGLQHDQHSATLTFTDGSTLMVPRAFGGRILDLDARGAIAQSLLSRSRSFASLERRVAPLPTAPGRGVSNGCLEEVGVNRVIRRRQPHEMRRFIALALDNISRDPWAYARGTLARAARVFIIQGSDDRRTALQFSGSGVVYLAGRLITVLYAVLCLAGVVVSLWRRLPIVWLLLPIVYVPSTIAFMLVNARYAMTAQPFMFAFIGVLAIAIIDRLVPGAAPTRQSPAAGSEWRAGGSA